MGHYDEFYEAEDAKRRKDSSYFVSNKIDSLAKELKETNQKIKELEEKIRLMDRKVKLQLESED